jgi:hypothetical protein
MVHCCVQMYFYRTAHGPLPRSDVLSMYCTRPAAAFKCTYTVPRTVHCRVPMHELLPPHHRRPGHPFTIPAQAGSHSAANTASSGQGEAAGKVVTSTIRSHQGPHGGRLGRHRPTAGASRVAGWGCLVADGRCKASSQSPRHFQSVRACTLKFSRRSP